MCTHYQHYVLVHSLSYHEPCFFRSADVIVPTLLTKSNSLRTPNFSPPGTVTWHPASFSILATAFFSAALGAA